MEKVLYLKVASLIHRIYQGVRSSWLNDVTRVTNHFHLSNARERENFLIEAISIISFNPFNSHLNLVNYNRGGLNATNQNCNIYQ